MEWLNHHSSRKCGLEVQPRERGHLWSGDQRMLVARAHKIAVWIAFVLLTAWLLIGSWQASPYSSRATQEKGAQSADGKTQHNEPWLTKDAAGFFAFLLVLVGGFQVVLFYVQLHLIRKSLAPAEEAAKAATATAIAVVDSERPWVGPITTSSQQIAPGQFIHATVVIVNSGQTPALEMRAAFKGSIKSKTDSADQPDMAQTPPKALFPHVPDWYYPFSKSLILSQADFDAICDGDKIAWILGKIEYLDNRRRPRYTNICTRWDQSRGVFVPNETGNDAI
jgi:hypothetical protein